MSGRGAERLVYVLYPFTQSPHFGSGSADVPQGMIGTLEVEFFGLPSIGRSE